MSYSNADYRRQILGVWAQELLQFTNVAPDVAMQEALIVQAEIDDELHAYHMQLCMDNGHDYLDIDDLMQFRGESLAIKKLYDERICSMHDVGELSWLDEPSLNSGEYDELPF